MVETGPEHTNILLLHIMSRHDSQRLSARAVMKAREYIHFLTRKAPSLSERTVLSWCWALLCCEPIVQRWKGPKVTDSDSSIILEIMNMRMPPRIIATRQHATASRSGMTGTEIGIVIVLENNVAEFSGLRRAS
jgi:hypothetical protein